MIFTRNFWCMLRVGEQHRVCCLASNWLFIYFLSFCFNCSTHFWLQCLLKLFWYADGDTKNSGGAPRDFAPSPLNWIRQVQRLVAVIWIWSRYGSYYIVSVTMGLKMRLQPLKQYKGHLLVCLRLNRNSEHSWPNFVLPVLCCDHIFFPTD